MTPIAAQIVRLVTDQGEIHVFFSRMAAPPESKHGMAVGWIAPEPAGSPHWFHMSLLTHVGPWWQALRETLPLCEIETAESSPAAVGLPGYGFTNTPEENPL